MRRVLSHGKFAGAALGRFSTAGTIEKRVAEVLERKWRLFNGLIAQNGLPPSLRLTEDDTFGLFDIRSRPKRRAAA